MKHPSSRVRGKCEGSLTWWFKKIVYLNLKFLEDNLFLWKNLIVLQNKIFE